MAETYYVSLENGKVILYTDGTYTKKVVEE